MKISFGLGAIIVMLWWASIAYAADPSPLQDFCVALPTNISDVFVNGRFCKNPDKVVAKDFLFQGLNIPGNTSNELGFAATVVNVDRLPGLNTLGVSSSRNDYAPYGVNPPHTHPRATEVLFLMEGTLYVGFVTSNPADPNRRNRLFARYLKPGDGFVFPQGLVHFQFNVGNTNAVTFSSFGSQLPGVNVIANAVFGSDPRIKPHVLAKAFRLEENIIDYLQAQFGPDLVHTY
ncbi:germin-like protein subfamily 1 member 16 [Salvia miltiorrhiza]|uniref:germin-like protein subfamily 1 member 16 n=1 Tax=Salvia miltiorrhiza TaxID=226208 RepID=UPI0025AD1BBD|nr:germin-like protein subfamily 1 member 16 [Salvia miltiorrhiza]